MKKILLLLIVVVMSSCELDQEPIVEVTEEEVFSDPELIESLVLAAYQPMGYEYIDDLTDQDSYVLPFIYTDGRSDDVVVENYLFGGNKIHDFEVLPNMNPSNLVVRGVWFKFYTGVARANDIIVSLGNVGSDVLDEATNQLFQSEAKFLRAYYYFEVVKNFGDAPLFAGQIDPTDLSSFERQSSEDIYSLIVQDLTEASQILPLTQANPKRATQGAALALLSKVYLYQQEWQLAADAAQDVIDLGIYELEENFGDNWKLDNEFGVESIIEIDYDDRTAFVFDSRQSSSLVAQMVSPTLTNPVLGWNYNLPGEELVQAFANEGDVIRREATFIEEGSVIGSEILAGQGLDPIPVGWFTEEANINDPNGGTQYGTSYVFSRKYFLTPEEFIATTSNIQHSPLNQKVMRYAEVLLILAEAVANGASGDGQAAFDQVRARAGLDSKTLTLDAIKLERRLELATEWNRFHDLVRWGDAVSEIEGFTEGRDEYLPIPIDEILITGTGSDGNFILTQNDGY